MSLLEKTKFDEIKATGNLPTPKGVALAIVQLTRDENVCVPEIVRALKADPALSGRIIKAANTANKARRPVAAVPDAVTVIGINTVKNLALGFSLISNYRNGKCRNFDYDRYWSRSLLVANAAQCFAAHAPSAAGEELFVCGLLGRIGQLALASAYPDAYSELLGRHADAPLIERRARERERFGISDDEMTAELLAGWGIPKQLAEPVRFHENPEGGPFAEGSRGALMCATLKLAAFFADATFHEPATRRRLLPQLFLFASRLGIDSEAALATGDASVGQWRDWAAMLGLDSGKVESYVALAKTAPAAAAEPVKAAAAPVAAEIAADPGGPGVAAPAAPTLPSKIRVLVVDDDAAVLQSLEKLMNAAGYEVHTAADGEAAMAVALQVQPQIVVTDWMMPRMDGLSLCKALRDTMLGRNCYVLILTSMEDEARVIQAYESGVDDYVVKPFNQKVLIARLRAGERMVKLQQEVANDRDEIRRLAAEMAVINRKLREAALIDALTAIPNRGYAMERLAQDWAGARRQSGHLACIMVDIDYFKRINDQHGHDAGDVVLKQAAQIMRQSARAQDMVCRIGGEEFLVICPNSDGVAAYLCAERLRTAIAAARFEVNLQRLPVTISVGVASMNPRTPDVASLLKEADRALYAAKDAGRNRTVVAEAGAAPQGRHLSVAR